MLRVKPPPNDELNRLLHTVNTVVEDHGQPPLYAAARTMRPSSYSAKSRRLSMQSKSNDEDLEDFSKAFHFSIAWTLKVPTEDLLQVTSSISRESEAALASISVNVGEIKNKVGNVVHKLDLVTKEVGGGNLFGL